MTTEQRSLLEDEWLLLSGGAALLCALLSAMNHGYPDRLFAPRAGVPAPQPQAQAQPLAPEAPIAQPQPVAQAIAPSPRALASKTPGRWLVDQRGGGDTASVAEAVANAKPGDVIVIRPGTYAESIVIDRSLTLKGEEGSAPPTLLGSGAITVSVQGGEVTLQGLSIAHKPNPGDQLQPALYVHDATLSARKLEIVELDPSGAANDACLALTHARLDLHESALSGCAMGLVGAQESTFTVSGTRFTNVGKIGVSALGKSEGVVDHSTFSRMYSALAVSQGATLKAVSVQIADGNRGLEAGPDSTAVLEDAEITDQKSAAVLIDSAIVRIERSRLVRNGYGIAVSHKAMLSVSGTKIIDSLKEPYHWSKAENVQFSGGGNDPEPSN